MTIATELREITKGLWGWHAFDESVRTDLFSTAIQAEEGLIVIDPILLETDHMNRLRRLGVVSAIVLTNGNHSRASAVFREALSAPVFAHPDAVGELTNPVDGTLRVSRKIGGNFEVLELPGGGEGEIALLGSTGSLHFGDAMIRTEKNGIEILPEKYCEDFSLLKTSLRTLKSKAVSLVTFAHGHPLLESAQEVLQAALDKL